MRTFIAIELPSELKDRIAKVISELRASDFCDAAWIPEPQLHLTLKFLGEINEKDVNSISPVLEKICHSMKAFYLQLKGVEHFNQKVIWMGGNTGQEETTKLANKIDSELHKLGFPKEKREFSTHLTLARIKHIKDKIKFQQILEEYADKDFGIFPVREIKLFQSVLTKQGPIYKELASFMLR
jgi:2'-5' RNA ligase